MDILDKVSKVLTRRKIHDGGVPVGFVAMCTEPDGREQGWEWTGYDLDGEWVGFYSTVEDAIYGVRGVARVVRERGGRHRY